jgi:predicted TIM-barrel fold metal-dependent hydrolase
MISDSGKFVDMVTATAKVDLRLSDFHPISCLSVPVHRIDKPRFPVIDDHNHLDSVDAELALRVMDAAGVERIVNITMQLGEAAFETANRFRCASARRFFTIGWMDWSDVEKPEFVRTTIERLQRMVDNGFVGIKFWKDFGLTVKGADGRLLRIDDERFAPIFDFCGRQGLPVMFHTADPTAFFQPLDATNERYEELAAHPDWGFSSCGITKSTLVEHRNSVIRRHPQTTFVGAHCAESSEDLASLSALLDELPNLQIDFSARTPELGRQPYSARSLFLNHADRIIFGTDLLPEIEMYLLYYRFLETADEHFEYPSHASRQGRWNIYGIFLPDDVLVKVYRENALKLLAPFI